MCILPTSVFTLPPFRCQHHHVRHIHQAALPDAFPPPPPRVQCLGGYPKPDVTERVMEWCSEACHDPAQLGEAECYVHVLATVPQVGLGLGLGLCGRRCGLGLSLKS